MLLTETNRLSRLQTEQLQKFGEGVNRLGADFAVCDSQGSLIFACESGNFENDWKSILTECIEFYENFQAVSGNQPFFKNDSILSAVLKSDGSRPQLFAIISLPGQITSGGAAKKKHSLQQTRLSAILSDYLSLLVESFQSWEKAEKSAMVFTGELSQVYEELALIHKLSAEMKISDSDQNYLKMACESLTDIVNVEGIAILLANESADKLVLAAGSGLVGFDEAGKTLLRERLIRELEQGREALLDSKAFSEFKYDWPENIQSIIAVPLYGRGHSASRPPGESDSNYLVGLLVAVNRLDKPDFDSADIKLFNSVATSCAVFVENGRLFNDLRDLFVGSLRALTSSIDAKDRYTRGHSERVALIAQWLAEKYSEREYLDREQIHNIYLAGLLHDIGKIGISEAVLCKKGKLTEDEMNCIKKHPSIGAGILSGIKQMHEIIPAVLCHHEHPDGNGYPNGLVGEGIPLAARIIGLADSFDAMTSERPYRPAMSIERALDEIRKNLGAQFDEKVGQVFLDSNIYNLWESLKNKNNVLLPEKEFAETDTVPLNATNE
jgi:HD-GYP domain-containing protein (c-di-GMP phosphodiesterase class II)